MLPITIRKSLEGKNGTNWPGVVVIDPDAYQPAAVYAQEAYEAMWKLNPINLFRRVTSNKARRQLEIEGHEVELQAAVAFYASKEETRRLAEAQSMKRGYKGLFDSMTPNQLVAAMKKASPKAARFVMSHRHEIEKYL